jgi:hypothetical protein
MRGWRVDFGVTVTGPAGEDLPVSRPLLARSKSASSVDGYFRQLIGTVTIPIR